MTMMSEHQFSYDPEADVCYRTLGFMGLIGYRVGDDGSVWSRWKQARVVGFRGAISVVSEQWKRMKLGKTKGGYAVVTLSRGGYKLPHRVSRLVLFAFVGPCLNGIQACHFPDRTLSNNSLPNLRWGTSKDNSDDKHRHGTMACGERNTKHKLLADQVIAARIEYRTGKVTFKALGRKYGVTKAAMHKAITGLTWSHIHD